MDDDASITPASELAPGQLRRLCDSTSLGFETTDDLPDLENVIGQPRAIRSLEIGSELAGPGYNTFVMGFSGSGRTTLSREYLERKAAAEGVADDWCYVNNFDSPRHPKVLRLPAGRGVEFARDIQDLIQHCETDVTRAFESDEYTQERDRLVGEMKKGQEAEFIRLQQHVEKYNFLLVRTPFGFMLVPAVQGKPLKPEDIEALSEEQKAKLTKLQSKLQEEVEKSLARLREIEKSTSQHIKDLNERTVLFTLGPVMEALNTKYEGLPGAQGHLEDIRGDIVANADQFTSKESDNPIERAVQGGARELSRRYEVNVLVDHSQHTGAPVVVENHPSYTNLLGRIEHEVIMGVSRTDFSMIQPGALHLANGGYLVLPGRELLNNPYAWEGLKRALRDGVVRIVELANQLGLISTVTLEPEPIPLNIKIVMVGTPLLYYLLRQYDEDFPKLFKVRAEFGTTMERTAETEREYGLFVKSVVDDNHLPPFHHTAIARIVEFSSRMAEDQKKLTTRFGKIADLVREAAYWAKKEAGQDQAAVSGEAVQKAIQEGTYRSNLLEERLQELVEDGTIMIEVSGEVVGQINALSITYVGEYAFGRTNRVTVSAYPGHGGVVDIERQADLSGPIHTKGIMILNGYLNKRYGQERPLNVSASITFEQSYEGIEGDSASAAELYAMLSAVADVPLRQDRAVTGSINQHGQIQPVGGVNEKIEGFYTTCKIKGLTGEQGVIIPANNLGNLMLNDEVVAAVESGQFHLWAIQHVDDGIPLLTGMPAGVIQEDGTYPEGSFNQTVFDRLEYFSKVDERRHKRDDEEDNPDSEGPADEQTGDEPVEEPPDGPPPGDLPVDQPPVERPGDELPGDIPEIPPPGNDQE